MTEKNLNKILELYDQFEELQRTYIGLHRMSVDYDVRLTHIKNIAKIYLKDDPYMLLLFPDQNFKKEFKKKYNLK